MITVYVNEMPPLIVYKSIFLAGPTPRSKDVASWRPDALAALEELGYDGVVFVPEPRSGEWDVELDSYNLSQTEWEEMGLNMADCIAFWVPRELETMPALTTNNEWGAWSDSGKVVFGAPSWAYKVNYQKYYANKYCAPIRGSLKGTLKAALKFVGEGAPRANGERRVPLYIWRTSAFHNWYREQREAGNEIDSARVEWVFYTDEKRSTIHSFILLADMFIEKEHKNRLYLVSFYSETTLQKEVAHGSRLSKSLYF